MLKRGKPGLMRNAGYVVSKFFPFPWRMFLSRMHGVLLVWSGWGRWRQKSLTAFEEEKMAIDISTSKRALILDMDGLMVDTERLFFESLNDFLAAMGHRLTREHFQQVVGKTTAENCVYLKEAFGLEMSHREIAQGWMRYFDTEIKDPDSVRLMPGLREVLELGRECGAMLAVASSSSRKRVERTVRSVLMRLGIGKAPDRFFHKIITRDDVERAKPDPAIFRLASERLGVEPGSCLVLEDSLVGVQAAKAAGMKVIAVPNHYSDEEGFTDSDQVAKSLLEVAENRFFGLL